MYTARHSAEMCLVYKVNGIFVQGFVFMPNRFGGGICEGNLVVSCKDMNTHGTHYMYIRTIASAWTELGIGHNTYTYTIHIQTRVSGLKIPNSGGRVWEQ